MKKQKPVEKSKKAKPAPPAEPQEMREGAGLLRGKPIVIGIGASAGGLDAIERILSRMPANAGFSIVIIQHLSPTHPSYLVELIGKMTQMPVEHAQNGIRVQPNHIYVIPPKSYIKYFRGQLLLTEPTYPKGLNLPIDVFFESLAQEPEIHAVGVVLSGTGSDGSTGVRALKEAGGTVIVQAVETSEFDGMPKNAIATGAPDFVLSPEEMPDALLNYLKHPFLTSGPVISRQSPEEGEAVMSKIFALLRERVGVDFSEYRPSTIDRRIERRMVVNQMTSLNDYHRFLLHSPREIDVLFNDFLIPVTGFFRDKEVFDHLRREIIPKIFEKPNPDKSIRIWVPACSTGEEAFTYAMLFSEERKRRGLNWDIKIFATDISKSAIDIGAVGFYPQGIATQVPVTLLEKYFYSKDHGYQVGTELRKMVVFALHDLTKNPPFTRLDLISCRNALIYFQPALQKKVISSLQFGLKPDGLLLLGTSESVGDLADRFENVSAKYKLFSLKQNVTATSLSFVPRVLSKHLPLSIEPKVELRHEEVAVSNPVLPEQVYKAIIQDQVSTCIVLDQHRNVVHVFGQISDYLDVSSGEFSQNLFKLFPKELSIAIASVMHKLDIKKSAKRRTDGELVLNRVQFRRGKTIQGVSVRIKRCVSETGDSWFFLIYLEPTGKPKKLKTGKTTFDLHAAASSRIAQLERELTQSKNKVQRTIGQLETANEELQSSNEELMSSNEELQSTNEELQSVNEELHTVNAEHQRRIDELTALTNDLNNLLKTSYVGFVLVDSDLRIRRISEAVEKMTSLRREDAGAPLETLGRVLNMPDLIQMAQEVLLRGITLNREVKIDASTMILLRLAPYVTDRLNVEGVVITFIEFATGSDGSVLMEKLRREFEDKLETNTGAVNKENKRLQEEGKFLQNENQLLNSIIEGSADLICAVDGSLRYIAFNNAYHQEILRRFGRKIQVGTSVAETFGGDQETQKEMLGLWERAFKEHQFSVNYSPKNNQKQSQRITFLVLRDAEGKVLGAMQTIHPILELPRISE